MISDYAGMRERGSLLNFLVQIIELILSEIRVNIPDDASIDRSELCSRDKIKF